MTLLIGLTVQASNVHALYSPRLSQTVSIIKEHVQSSQAQNGSKTILEEIENFKAFDKAKRDEGRETGISGDARVAQDLIFNTTINFFTLFPLDSIMMIFNFNATNGEWLSNCLRDEIWNLETLRDFVGSEMVKAYMLRDTYHGEILMVDYIYLSVHLDLLRKYGSDPTAMIQTTEGEYSSNNYFFGEKPQGPNPLNYYSNVGIFDSSDPTGCPEGEFEAAFDQVLRSFEVLKVLGSGQGVEWGDIWTMAEANARIRAREWIRDNQISLTIGGEEGGSTESLVKGGGWDKFVGSVKTQLEIAKNMVGPVTAIIDYANSDKLENVEKFQDQVEKECILFDPEEGKEGEFRNCEIPVESDMYRRCKEGKEPEQGDVRCDRFRNRDQSFSVTHFLHNQIELIEENAKAKKEVETAFIYSITMDSVAENGVYFMGDLLWDMNSQIKRGYEDVHEDAGESIPTLTREVAALSARQCQNKPKK